MIEYIHIHHVSLAVRDLQKSIAFYSDILKFQPLERPPFQSSGQWYAIGNQQLHLIETPAGETLRTSEINSSDGHFAIWVKSYKETIAWLERYNIAFEAKPDSIAGFAQIFILDIDHNIIEFDSAYHS